MYFPRRRHLDSVTYIRTKSPDSGRNIIAWRLSGNASGNDSGPTVPIFANSLGRAAFGAPGGVAGAHS